MRHSTALLVVVLLATAGRASAQDSRRSSGLGSGDPVTAIKNLYESAAYEDALSAIDRLSTRGAGSIQRPMAELRTYRALCLLALERTDEAERVIEGLILDNPRYQPEAQSSPRWVNAVGSVYSRVVPALARSQYSSGKRHFDQREFASAAADFEMALSLLDNPVLDPSVAASLAEVVRLSQGLLDSSSAAMAAAVTIAPDRSPVATSRPGSGLSGWMAEFTKFSLYFLGDQGVTPPVVVQQQAPPWRSDLHDHFDGSLEIIISERGDVESAVLRKPVHPLYNRALIESTQRWKYEPAIKDGIPVRFSKTLKISLDPN